MKIIIDIPKKVYDQICDQNLDGIMATAIRCGKPLLKDTLQSAQPADICSVSIDAIKSCAEIMAKTNWERMDSDEN